jgi:hypothetical protein
LGKTIKAEDYTAMLAEFVTDDPLGPKLHRLIRLSADETKSGRKRASTAWNGFVEPVKEMRESGLADHAILYGIDQALAANAPNINYVKKAAKNAPRGAGVETLADRREREARRRQDQIADLGTRRNGSQPGKYANLVEGA